MVGSEAARAGRFPETGSGRRLDGRRDHDMATSSLPTPSTAAGAAPAAEHAGHPVSASPKLVLALASGASFLAVLDTTVVNVALPNLHSSFATASLPQLTWIITAYAVM